MLWGIKFYNDFLSEAGSNGNVQSELLFRKDASTFTFEKGWAFPRRIYFNGDNCVMPPPDAYPWLPNASSRPVISLLRSAIIILASWVFLLACPWWIISEAKRLTSRTFLTCYLVWYVLKHIILLLGFNVQVLQLVHNIKRVQMHYSLLLYMLFI